MAENKFVLRPTILHICIDEIDPDTQIQSGTISGIALKEKHHFSDVAGFLLLVDRLLDEIGRPQASRQARSFQKDEKPMISYSYDLKTYHSSDEIQAEKGKLCTYNINFETRLYSSWQGSLFDENGAFVATFSSDLQLLELLKHRD